MIIDNMEVIAVARRRYRDDDGVERYAAVAAFSSYDDAVSAVEAMNERCSLHGARFDIAPLTPAVENWTR